MSGDEVEQHEMICPSCQATIRSRLADAADRAELQRLRARDEKAAYDLREAAETLRAVGKAALVVKPTLDKPYLDAPAQTPWSRFMETPARAAYNLGVRLSRELARAHGASTGSGES